VKECRSSTEGWPSWWWLLDPTPRISHISCLVLRGREEERSGGREGKQALPLSTPHSPQQWPSARLSLLQSFQDPTGRPYKLCVPLFHAVVERESSLPSHHLQAIKPASAQPAEVKDVNKRKRRHSSVGTDASGSSERPKSRKGKERADEEAVDRFAGRDKKAKGDKKLVPVEEIMAGGSGAWQQECVFSFFSLSSDP
jgi:hypothetical protein